MLIRFVLQLFWVKKSFFSVRLLYSSNRHGIDAILTTFVTEIENRTLIILVTTASVILFIGVEGKSAVGMLVDEIIVRFVTPPSLTPIPSSYHFSRSWKSLRLALSFVQVSRIPFSCTC
jgi:hypothetical protein